MGESLETPDGMYKLEDVWFKMLPRENVEAVLNLRPRDNDVVVATYAKSGTTWTQSILAYLQHYDEFDGSMTLINKFSPFVEFVGVAQLPQPSGTYKTHIWLDDRRWNPSAKYIWVVRNPKDVCVSLFFHIKGLGFYPEPFGMKEFVDIFTSDEIICGSYFKHLDSFWKVKDEPNVLLVKFEEVKQNAREQILRVANFVGGKAKEMADNQTVLDDIVKGTQFDNMKGKINKDFRQMCEQMGFEKGEDFCRKGIVGDWKNHLDENMESKIDDWIEKTPGANAKLRELFGDLI